MLSLKTEISAEIARLENLIPEILAELNDAINEINNLENDLSYFLSDYYKSVAEFFKNEHIYSDKETPNNYKIPPSIPIDLKILYKELAKLCHPDTSSIPAHVFPSLKEAYNNQNLHKMFEIKQYLHDKISPSNESILKKLDRLTTEYDQLLEVIKTIKARKQEILTSPAYELKQKILLAKIQGYDLVNEIKKQLRLSIEKA